MPTSQNGWPVLSGTVGGAAPTLRKWIVPGTKRHFIARDGSAGFLLVHLALWWHETIEKIDTGVWDEWGYAYRPIRGQSSGFSNHASGTALDINATQHPLGVSTSRTFSADEIAKIHARLRLYSGCIRWGGDYSSRPDAMHVEINAPLATCEKKARALLDSPRGKRILEANPGAKAVILS